MKTIILLLMTFMGYMSIAQNKLSTTKGYITFEASVPYFEEVKAKNEEVSCVLIPKRSELSFVVNIKKFLFKRDLMREHFNSNYIESDLYPKATFKGIIENFDYSQIDEVEKTYQIKGKIEIHGVTKKIVVYAKLRKIDNSVALTSNFTLNSDDFKIEIPSIVVVKVSKNVNTQIDCVLQ